MKYNLFFLHVQKPGFVGLGKNGLAQKIECAKNIQKLYNRCALLHTETYSDWASVSRLRSPLHVKTGQRLLKTRHVAAYLSIVWALSGQNNSRGVAPIDLSQNVRGTLHAGREHSFLLQVYISRGCHYHSCGRVVTI